MSDHGDSSRWIPGIDADGGNEVEVYETGDATVLYDAHNPLAWIESSSAVPLDDAA